MCLMTIQIQAKLGSDKEFEIPRLEQRIQKLRGAVARILIGAPTEVEIEDKHVRVDTYRASGAGGQHVNKTDSAVRLTYDMPGEESPIVVACQTDRSQHKNRSNAWAMLRARVYEIELQRREAASQADADSKTEIGWGHQIRSYVLQPYQMVKDLRTEVETSNSQAVLDGDLDLFMAASLAQRVAGEEI